MVESKGYLEEVQVGIGDQSVAVTFYDPVRLAQDIADDMNGRKFSHWKRLLVAESINRDSVQRAVDAAPDDFFA